jgi:ribosome maturation factor RimP
VVECFDKEKITELVKEILDELSLRLYDMHFNEVSKTLKIFIDKKQDGVTVDDCKKVSTLISRKLDESDYVIAPYTLEVSSPGVERPLKRPEHYEWAFGKLVSIDTDDEKLKGYIRDMKENGVVVATDKGEVFVSFSSIVKANVVEELLYGKRR